MLCQFQAFAASKDDIISKLQSAGVATEYVNAAKQFLADNTVSDADAAYYVIAKIDAATATANGVKGYRFSYSRPEVSYHGRYQRCSC